MDSQYLKNIKKGMKVEILTDQNRISRGLVEDILSRGIFQMSGIKVRLSNGDIGRVQRIMPIEKTKEEDDNIEVILERGENFYCEFKSSSLWSMNFTEEDIKKSRSLDLHFYKQKASKVIIAKSIAGFLNSEGGMLLIGVKEKKENNGLEVIGVDDEFKKLKDPYKDGYKRMIIDEIIKPYFPPKISNHLNEFISINLIDYNNKIICLIKIKKSNSMVFLKINDKEIFVIRIETENRILEGERLVEYCIKHFSP